jgi:pimeloyl-ACP methyl ester carboxylesterase
MQEQLARMSPDGRRVVATAAGHWVPLDEPEVVVSAIRDVVDQVRARAA